MNIKSEIEKRSGWKTLRFLFFLRAGEQRKRSFENEKYKSVNIVIISHNTDLTILYIEI